MRKFFLFFAAVMATISFTFVYANDIVIRVKENGQTLIPRSERPVISANVDSGICRTNVSGEYIGNVHVAIKDVMGDTLISQTESVCDGTQFFTDVTNLEDGSYTITYTLEDSTIYEGEFEKE